ncbi:metal ABC transporter permease [Anthocerotibacter panamensis]|uniref:metal ABC transporter permease n=1 Tax=Anthocerotibacter panamensis TaxID=2857077 RepID=UPI001C403374|nr:metal ABC transporter permease [Anthocerotibacter panamensis]
MADFLDLLTYPFMVRALGAAVLLGLACSLLGTLVVIRRMAFFSDAVAHFALPAIVVALWLGWDVGTFLTVFCVLAALAILWVKEHSQIPTDTVMGVFSAGAVAVGVMLMGTVAGGQGRVFNVLFGDILAVRWVDLWVLAFLSILVGTFMLLTLQTQVVANFQPDLARVNQLPVKFFDYAFIVLLALVVATALKLVGALLVTAFLVVPAACARNQARSFLQMLLFAPLVGVVGAVLGVLGAAILDTPAGPTMVLAQVVLFGGSLLVADR